MKQFILLTTLILLTGCQALMEEHQRQMSTLCTYEGAFSKGVQDAENGSGSNAMQTLSSCAPEMKGASLKGYNDGYASVNQPQRPRTLGGLFGEVIDTATADDSLFNCEIEVFTDTFSAKGKSREEALFNAQNECTSNRHDGDFFCKDQTEYKCTQLY